MLDLMDRMTDATQRLLREPRGNGVLDRLSSRVRRFGGHALVNRMVAAAIPFAGRNGFTVTDIRPGFLEARIPLKGNRNHIGTLYAGAEFLLAEIPGGVLTLLEFGSAYFPILEAMNMRFLAPAKSDVTVTFRLSKQEIKRVRDEADREGRSRFILTGNLLDKDGRIVAQSEAHYVVRKK
ncbi:YiiD C-terminal domain-containing protein [Marinobacteraceae bacterium S3BR75-40.1]